MRPKRPITLFDIAAHNGLQIEYATDLPATFQGCIPPGDDPRFILVNANQPIFEQRFTIAHEIAHYLLHHNRARRNYSNWYLRCRWNFWPLRLHQRCVRRWIFRHITEEFEADTWALSLLMHIGDKDTLEAYLKHHPEKIAYTTVLYFFAFVRALPHTLLNREPKRTPI